MRHYYLILLIIPVLAKAQQLPNHYGLDANAFAWNPALAGKFDYRSLGASFNQPWSGFEDAPKNIQVFGESPILERSLSVGIALEGEQATTYERINGTAAVNYKFRFGYQGRRQLAIGIAVRYERMNIAIDNPTVNDLDDPLLGLNRNAYRNLYAGGGLFFSTQKDYFRRSFFFAGIAAFPAISTGEGGYAPAIHASAQAGAHFKLSGKKWFFEPVLWADYSETLQIYPQLSLKVERDRYYWARLHATTNSIALNLGAMIILNETMEIRLGATARAWYGAIQAYNQVGMDGEVVLRQQMRDRYY